MSTIHGSMKEQLEALKGIIQTTKEKTNMACAKPSKPSKPAKPASKPKK